MKITVLIYCCDIDRAYVDVCHGSICEVHTNATLISLNVDKGDMVLRGHGMMDRAHLNTYLAVAKQRDHGHVLLATGIYNIGL